MELASAVGMQAIFKLNAPAGSQASSVTSDEVAQNTIVLFCALPSIGLLPPASLPQSIILFLS